MFSLLKPTDVKVKNVITLSQKNRKPDEKPGVKLKLSMQLPTDALEHFGAHLTEFLYEPPTEVKDNQGTLEGVEAAPKKSARLTELGAKIAKLPLTYEMTGYTVEIIIGTGRMESNVLIKDCILSDWVMQFKEGGTVVADCSMESPDVSKGTLGELGSMKSRTMSMTMTPPEVHQSDIEDVEVGPDGEKITPATPRKPGAAERAAVARAGGDAGPKEPHKAAPAAAVSGEGAWPFPKGKGPGVPGEAPPQSATTEVVKGKAAAKKTAPAKKTPAAKPADKASAQAAAATGAFVASATGSKAH